MFTGPVGPVEFFLYWPEAIYVNFYWPGASVSLLSSSPVPSFCFSWEAQASEIKPRPLSYLPHWKT